MASTGTWFESVAEAQRRARRRVPSSVYRALVAGAERGATLADNVAAFGELGFVPRIATGLAPLTEVPIEIIGTDDYESRFSATTLSPPANTDVSSKALLRRSQAHTCRFGTRLTMSGPIALKSPAPPM